MTLASIMKASLAFCLSPAACRLILLVQLLAFWSLGPWYIKRLAESGGETWGILALVTAVVFIIREARNVIASDLVGRPMSLLWSALFTLIYAASYVWLPPLARTCLAVTALTATVSVCFLRRQFHTGIWGLLLLSLPVMDSLQFFVGYPLRALVAALAAALLRLGGLAVAPQGAALRWGETLVAVDAPCSGIRMLWVGAYLVVALACLYRLGFMRLLAGVGLALVVLVLGNALRAAALFYLEAGIIPAPSGAHTAIGIVTFGFTVVAIVAMLDFLRRTVKCVPWHYF